MTTRVTVENHGPSNVLIEVVKGFREDEVQYLKESHTVHPGENESIYVYDNQTICILEIK